MGKKEEEGEKKEDEAVKEEAKEEPKEETKEEEAPKAEEAEEKPAEEDEETEPPTAELTEEEMKATFATGFIKDLSDVVLNKAFGDFSIPDKSEGFDEVKFVWQKEKPSKDYLQKWVLERKRTSRIEDLKPSEWFTNKQADFTQKMKAWEE